MGVRSHRASDVSVFWGALLGELACLATLAAVCGGAVALIVIGGLIAVLAGGVIYAGWWLHTWSERNLRRQERDMSEEEHRVRPADL